MQIHGFNKTTLLDYPGRVAATVFTGGCNFRCPFCHNGELVLGGGETMDETEVLTHLAKRRGILEGVCVTGGEPTLQRDLRTFLKRIKELGYAVKLDTNGYRPNVLWSLLSEKLVDYVAMDVKADKLGYAAAAGLPQFDLSRIEESMAMLAGSGIAYEYRTTAVKGIHTVEQFGEIARWIAAEVGLEVAPAKSNEREHGGEGAEVNEHACEKKCSREAIEEASERGFAGYYIQNFRENENCLYLLAPQGTQGGTPQYASFTEEELVQIKEQAERYLPRVSLRGV